MIIYFSLAVIWFKFNKDTTMLLMKMQKVEQLHKFRSHLSQQCNIVQRDFIHNFRFIALILTDMIVKIVK